MGANLKPSRQKKSQMVLQERRVQVAAMYRTRLNQYEIATRLGVSQATVCHDLQALSKQWKNERMKNFDSMRQRELEELDDMEAEMVFSINGIRTIVGELLADSEDASDDDKLAIVRRVQWRASELAKVIDARLKIKRQRARMVPGLELERDAIINIGITTQQQTNVFGADALSGDSDEALLAQLGDLLVFPEEKNVE